MIKILFVAVFLIGFINGLPFCEKDQPKNLDETLVEVAASIKHTTKSLEDNVDFVITSALSDLSQPIQDFQNTVILKRCQPYFTFERLGQRIESDLDKCTQNLNDVLNTFQKQAKEYNNVLEQKVKEIENLSKKCEGKENGSGFGSSITCYVKKISEAYKEISIVLKNVSMTVERTHKLDDEAVKKAQICTNDVVDSTIKFMDKILGYCNVVKQ